MKKKNKERIAELEQENDELDYRNFLLNCKLTEITDKYNNLISENAELKKEIENLKPVPKPKRDVKEIMEWIKANPEIDEILLYRKMRNDNSCSTKDIVEIGILKNNTFGVTISDNILMNIIGIQIGNQHFDIEDFV